MRAAGKEIKAALVSVRYGAGPTIAFRDRLSFEWSLDKPDALKELEQRMEIEGASELDVRAKFEAKKGTTTIRVEADEDDGEQKIVRTGLVLLQLVTAEGQLRIEH